MWLYIGLFASVFYGLHNIFKKFAVRDNEVFPVIWLTTFSGFIIIVPFYLGSFFFPDLTNEIGLIIPVLSPNQHFLIFIKSCLMAGSWVLSYQALKNLPITIVTPIRSAGPFFTFIGAVLIYSESPNILLSFNTNI